MSTIASFYRAQPMPGQTIHPVSITIAEPFPDFGVGEDALARSAETYRSEGVNLEAILNASLAGGVYDQLLAAMLKRRATLLRVPWGKGTPAGDDEALGAQVRADRAERRVDELVTELRAVESRQVTLVKHLGSVFRTVAQVQAELDKR